PAAAVATRTAAERLPGDPRQPRCPCSPLAGHAPRIAHLLLRRDEPGGGVHRTVAAVETVQGPRVCLRAPGEPDPGVRPGEGGRWLCPSLGWAADVGIGAAGSRSRTQPRAHLGTRR